MRARIGRMCGLAVLAAAAVFAQSAPPPVLHVGSFPEPEHHWLEIEMTLSGVAPTPLVGRMSRSSPGRIKNTRTNSGSITEECVAELRDGGTEARTRPI